MMLGKNWVWQGVQEKEEVSGDPKPSHFILSQVFPSS